MCDPVSGDGDSLCSHAPVWLLLQYIKIVFVLDSTTLAKTLFKGRLFCLLLAQKLWEFSFKRISFCAVVPERSILES